MNEKLRWDKRRHYIEPSCKLNVSHAPAFKVKQQIIDYIYYPLFYTVGGVMVKHVSIFLIPILSQLLSNLNVEP